MRKYFFVFLLATTMASWVGSDQKKPTESKAAMNVPEFYQAMQGSWSGTYNLWLDPTKPPETSTANATSKMIANGAYCLFTYQWAQGEKSQEGIFFLSGLGEKAMTTWGDSFHSVPEPMECKGSLVDKGKKLIFNGNYSGGPGQPDWGWRTEFSMEDSEYLKMEAFNVAPDGKENIAVRCEFLKK